MKSVIRFVVLAVAIALAATVQAQNVLIYDNNTEDNVAQTACTNLGYTCTVANESTFLTLLIGGPWSLVVMDMPSNTPSGPWQLILAAYVTGGGRVIQTGWNADDFTTLAAVFEVSLGSDHNPLTFYQWNGHPTFTTPNLVPSTMVPVDDAWGDNGFYFTTVGGGVAASGFTAAPAAGQAATVVGNGGRTIFNGFLFDDYYPADVDTDLKADIIELVENQMAATVGPAYQPSEAVPALGLGGLLTLATVLAGLGLIVLGRRRLL